VNHDVTLPGVARGDTVSSFADEERTMCFASLGYRVIRFWNSAIMKDINSVILAIIYTLENGK
jgi:very-short-patch-repair endonuclease